MKKFIVFVVTAVMAFALCSCAREPIPDNVAPAHQTTITPTETLTTVG